MREGLRRTAIRTNSKERLDFPYALLHTDGELAVNAPHIPVHRGALGLRVRSLHKVIEMHPGDFIITDHPAFDGSHMPDMTIITPVFSKAGTFLGYAANGAHDAEIGDSRPGALPPQALPPCTPR